MVIVLHVVYVMCDENSGGGGGDGGGGGSGGSGGGDGVGRSDDFSGICGEEGVNGSGGCYKYENDAGSDNGR